MLHGKQVGRDKNDPCDECIAALYIMLHKAVYTIMKLCLQACIVDKSIENDKTELF